MRKACRQEVKAHKQTDLLRIRTTQLTLLRTAVCVMNCRMGNQMPMS